MASGWLSLTPRSSRLRATIAAMAISSLSFSRGVRFMRSKSLTSDQTLGRPACPLSRPTAAPAACAAISVPGKKPRKKLASSADRPGAGAALLADDLAGRGSMSSASRRRPSTVATAIAPPATAGRPSVAQDRGRCAKSSAWTSRPVCRTRQRSRNIACLTRSPMASRPNSVASTISASAPSARSTSSRPGKGGAVVDDGFLRQPGEPGAWRR